jgi:hypothetical protein
MKDLTTIQIELEKITNGMPETHHDLVTGIDRYIFGAQKGFELSSALYTLALDNECSCRIEYEKEYAKNLMQAKQEAIQITILDKYAKSKTVDKYTALISAENITKRTAVIRMTWIEKLNSYKKIKSDNINEKQGG